MHRRLVGLLVPVLAATLAAPAASAQTHPRPDVAADWLTQTVEAAAATGNEASARRVWAITWLAARRGIATNHPTPDSFQDAAVAAAMHDVLVALVPGRTNVLDAALADSLAAIPDSHGERAGIHAGQRAAARTLRERDGDGLDPASVNRPFPDPPPAPGVYRLPADATTPTQLAGMSDVRPFVLHRAGQFRPGPPPALGSDTYRRDLDEVRRTGSATSAERTRQQTEVALLWAQSAVTAWTAPLRVLIADPVRPLSWKVRLLAAFAVATLDAGIAVADSKYAYLWWRPITAIRDIGLDPTWAPLRPTPAHPEYTSGHTGFAGAAEQVLERFAGPRTPVAFTISNPGQGVSRTYPRGTRWSAITQEVTDARVWIGAHFRTSDEAGATLGRRVADHVLTHLA